MTLETIGLFALAVILGGAAIAIATVFIGIAATIAARLYREAGKGEGRGRSNVFGKRGR